MTVAQLKKRLETWPDHYEITFGGGVLDFFDLIQRDENKVDVEFNQLIFSDKKGQIHVEQP